MSKKIGMRLGTLMAALMATAITAPSTFAVSDWTTPNASGSGDYTITTNNDKKITLNSDKEIKLEADKKIELKSTEDSIKLEADKKIELKADEALTVDVEADGNKGELDIKPDEAMMSVTPDNSDVVGQLKIETYNMDAEQFGALKDDPMGVMATLSVGSMEKVEETGVNSLGKPEEQFVGSQVQLTQEELVLSVTGGDNGRYSALDNNGSEGSRFSMSEDEINISSEEIDVQAEEVTVRVDEDFKVFADHDILLDAEDEINIHADDDVTIRSWDDDVKVYADDDITLDAEDEINIHADDDVTIRSWDDDVIVRADDEVRIDAGSPGHWFNANIDLEKGPWGHAEIGYTSLFGSWRGLYVDGFETTLSGGNIFEGITTLTLNEDGAFIDNNLSVDKDLAVGGHTTTHGLTSSHGKVSLNSSAAGANGNAGLELESGVGAKLQYTNSIGNTHGIVITEDSTVITGGTSSTKLVISDSGAHFTNPTNTPVKVTGVAAGSADTDAANISQLGKAYSGVASVAALAAIPVPANGKRFTMGVGYGAYQGESAFAMGFKGSVTSNISVTAGAGFDGTFWTPSAGVGFSW